MEPKVQSPDPAYAAPVPVQHSGVAPQYAQQPQQGYYQQPQQVAGQIPGQVTGQVTGQVPGQPMANPQQPPPSYPAQPVMDPSVPGGYHPHPAGQSSYGMPLVSLNAQPCPVQCPHCGHRGMTAVSHESGGFTHLVALLFCCVICLGCIPYLVASMKDTCHKCTSCGTALATYHRSGRTEVHYQPAP